MRRLLYALAAATGLLCGLTGCYCNAGICDCDVDEDPCVARAPWFRTAPAVPGELIHELPYKANQ